MTAINQYMFAESARQRFERIQLPQGTDRARFAGYIATMCGAIAQAFEIWRRSAYLDGVRIHAAIATGGKLRSVPLDPLILQRAPSGWDVYNRAIAAGVHNQIQSFANEVTVPGLTWYPTFVAFPGPMAPPTPNVPSPLMALSGFSVRHLKEGTLTDAIYNKLPRPTPAAGKEIAIAISAGLEKALLLWLPMQQVSLVLGKGPIPSFAPPYVPVGPVVGGDIIATPGHIAS